MNVLHLTDGTRQVVAIQNDEIGQLSRFQRAFFVLFESLPWNPLCPWPQRARSRLRSGSASGKTIATLNPGRDLDLNIHAPRIRTRGRGNVAR